MSFLVVAAISACWSLYPPLRETKTDEVKNGQELIRPFKEPGSLKRNLDVGVGP
ncbi:hypothetical protein J6590_088291, partial [Homalodisca vitripennis]